jgi:AAA+ superfamily predicted ATPase
MPVDPAHLAVLESALAESPDNVTLRTHVAGLHLELSRVDGSAQQDDAVAPTGDAGANGSHASVALTHAQQVLATEPDHIDALRVAAEAARLSGDDGLAARYHRVVAALDADSAPTAPPPTAPPPTAPPRAAPPPTPPPPTAPPPPPPRIVPPPTPLPPNPRPPNPSSPGFDHPSLGGSLGGPTGPASAPLAWSADGSHDDIDGVDPLWISIADEGDDIELITELDVPTVRFDDVGGLDDVKRRLRTSFLSPLQNPELRQLYRKSLRGGMLLYGPPGCGKTFLARAIAGELRARFFAVGLHDILDMWLGNSEKNVHQIFETARRHAPCVLFLDEVDALGHKRSNFTSGSGGRNVVVQLLNEMDGLRDDNEGVFVVGATNQPWDIDPALRRPGRFDRMMLVLPPDATARAAILAYHLRDRPLAPGIDLGRLASRTELHSGADLRLIVESAAEIALDDSLATGTARPISAKDLDVAAKDVHASTRAWFEVARNFAQFANEGGRYDDLLDYLRAHRLG